MKKIIYFFFVLLFVSSCEDVVEVDSGFKNSQLVVDAWLDNMERTQTIRITESQDYFNSAFAKDISGATVKLTNQGKAEILFSESSPGVYEWTPGAGETIGEVGDNFILDISINGQNYRATSQMNRVPTIDSIAQVYEEEQLGIPEGNYAELFATDFLGQGDTYWAKTWKNGDFLNKPIEILVIYDATFDAGNNLDGIQFIFPIRRGINPIPDEFNDDTPPPYMPGDSIYVELHSITNEAFNFWIIAQEQMINGQNGIFALPLANTRSNILDQSTGERILGIFNVSAVETASKVIQ